MPLRLDHLRHQVVRPALTHLAPHVGWTLAAENLVLATAIAESDLSALHQIGGGPALGLWQIEPATHADLWANWLTYRGHLAARLETMAAPWPPVPQNPAQVATNLLYGAAVCRLIYYRAPAPLPAKDDADGMGRYWKQHYNTPLGAGDPAKFATLYRRHVMEE